MKKSPIKRSKGKPTHFAKPEKRSCPACGERGFIDAGCLDCGGTDIIMYRRLILSAADWRQMKRALWLNISGYPRCGICQKVINHYENYEPDHIQPRGMGGGKRDDSPSNIQPSHSWCNRFVKGSKRVTSSHAL